MKWTPRDTAQQLQRLTRHTSMVQAGKYALIGVALLLVFMVFLVPVLHDDDTGARLVFTNVETGVATSPRMSNPRLQGLDKNEQPYTVTADMAEQQENGKVLLTKLQADLALSNGSWLAFIADTGIYDSDSNILILPQSVQVFHNTGYDMRTSNVTLNLKTSEASSDEQVDGQGPLGKLNAAGFRVDSGANNILFTPRVTVTLYPKGNP